jgi:hypothetical protein
MSAADEAIRTAVEQAFSLSAKLVEAAQHHVAVVVIGAYGSGKIALCDHAIKKMGRESRTIFLPELDPTDIPGCLDRLPTNSGVILDGAHQIDQQSLIQLALALTAFVRVDDGVAFVILPPDTEERKPSWVLSYLEIATGATLGLQQTVEVQ